MLSFLKSVLASCLGFVLSFIVLIVIVTFFLVGAVSTTDPTEALSGNNYLEIDFSNTLVEKSEINPLDDIDVPLFSGDKKIGVNQIYDVLSRAATDDRVKAVVLKVESIDGTQFAKLQEVREAIIDFKQKSEKPVIAFGEYMTEKSYYLATSADEIYVSPMGLVEFRGLKTELLFFKGLFEKLNIEPRVFRVGKYKSAVEPFLRRDMSVANKEQVSSFLESIYAFNLDQIGSDRGIKADSLRSYSNSLVVRNVEDAINYQLIDGAKYYSDVIKELSSRFEKEDRLLDKLKFANYLVPEELKMHTGDKLAVVVAEGEIISGKSMDSDQLGSDTFNKNLKAAVEDDNVKGIVVRINSPGGSALASDVMWKEIKSASKKKPVICSMSDLAASGGYYMAVACDKIYAHENTITGSIGVFGLTFELNDFLNEKLGVTTDRVTTGDHSTLGSPLVDMSDADSTIIQQEIERIYDVFTSKVAEGRNMTVDAVKEVASGRVWTGAQAKEVGLVDELGSLNDAINFLSDSLGMDNYTVDYYPKNQGFWGKLTSGVDVKLKERYLKNELGVDYTLYQNLTKLKQMEGIQARIPFDIDIR